jgi:hypothetical protein
MRLPGAQTQKPIAKPAVNKNSWPAFVQQSRLLTLDGVLRRSKGAPPPPLTCAGAAGDDHLFQGNTPQLKRLHQRGAQVVPQDSHLRRRRRGHAARLRSS